MPPQVKNNIRWQNLAFFLKLFTLSQEKARIKPIYSLLCTRPAASEFTSGQAAFNEAVSVSEIQFSGMLQ